jgi:hypothetical protein
MPKTDIDSAVLYDGRASTPSGRSTPTPHPLAEAAGRLYDGSAAPSAMPAPTPGADAGERLYGHGIVRQHVARLTADLWPTLGVGADAQEEEAQFWEQQARETGLPEGLVMALAEGSIKNRLASARIEDDPEAAETALRQQVVEWQQDVRERLKNTYGARQAEELVERANRFLSQYPKLGERLVDRWLGSRPDIVEAVIAHVFSNGLGR